VSAKTLASCGAPVVEPSLQDSPAACCDGVAALAAHSRSAPYGGDFTADSHQRTTATTTARGPPPARPLMIMTPTDTTTTPAPSRTRTRGPRRAACASSMASRTLPAYADGDLPNTPPWDMKPMVLWADTCDCRGAPLPIQLLRLLPLRRLARQKNSTGRRHLQPPTAASRSSTTWRGTPPDTA
jgi:hypothetical protein